MRTVGALYELVAHPRWGYATTAKTTFGSSAATAWQICDPGSNEASDEECDQRWRCSTQRQSGEHSPDPTELPTRFTYEVVRVVWAGAPLNLERGSAAGGHHSAAALVTMRPV
jgi:hypothetical protein